MFEDTKLDVKVTLILFETYAKSYIELNYPKKVYIKISFDVSVPMNKIVVGVTASPNLKQVRSKIGSLENASYKPGGGEVKIESRKLEWKTNARTTNFNDGYVPKGGDKKVTLMG